MTKEVFQSPTERYIVPARQLSGTRDEVLAQIDDLIVGLTGLRQLVSMHGPTPAEAPRRRLRLVRSFLKVLLLFSGVFWVLPAQAQTPAPSPPRSDIQGLEGSVTQQTSPGDPWRGVTFGATIETFYQYNWNRVPDRSLLLRAYDTRANTLADGFLTRAEFRRDWSDERFFPGRLGRTDLRHGQNTVLLGGRVVVR